MVTTRYHSYFWRHLAVWIIVSLALSGPMYATGRSVDMPFIDALFYVVSATTATGLATRDLASETLASQIFLLFCMLVSGAVFESMIPLIIRLWATRHTAQPPDEENPGETTENREEDRKTSIYMLVSISLYYFFNCLVTFLVLGFYFQFASEAVAVCERNHVNAWWLSMFQAVSAFNDCGLAVLFDSLTQFNSQILPLIFYGLMILAGNNAYPIFMRGILRITEFILRRCGSPMASHFHKVLAAPRSFVTHLFPASRTWLLLLLLIIFIGFQTIMMVALPNDEAFEGLSDGYIFANALFQSISVRAAGLNSIPIGNLSNEALVIMIVMMYIAAYPITVTLRSTNEEQSRSKQKTSHQLRRLLMQDAMWVIVPWYLVCAIENYESYGHAFKTLFEVVSAYGTIGLSIGLRNFPYSFSGSLSIPSKIVIMLSMMLGRHRGMPDHFDTAFSNVFTRPIEVKARSTET